MNAADTVIAAAAGARHGIVTRTELLSVGLSVRDIDWRLEQRLLLRMHHGGYRHAAAPSTPNARLLAAVLASGAEAVASHRSAAAWARWCLSSRLRERLRTPSSAMPSQRST